MKETDALPGNDSSVEPESDNEQINLEDLDKISGGATYGGPS